MRLQSNAVTARDCSRDCSHGGRPSAKTAQLYLLRVSTINLCYTSCRIYSYRSNIIKQCSWPTPYKNDCSDCSRDCSRALQSRTVNSGAGGRGRRRRCAPTLRHNVSHYEIKLCTTRAVTCPAAGVLPTRPSPPLAATAQFCVPKRNDCSRMQPKLST